MGGAADGVDRRARAALGRQHLEELRPPAHVVARAENARLRLGEADRRRLPHRHPGDGQSQAQADLSQVGRHRLPRAALRLSDRPGARGGAAAEVRERFSRRGGTGSGHGDAAQRRGTLPYLPALQIAVMRAYLTRRLLFAVVLVFLSTTLSFTIQKL